MEEAGGMRGVRGRKQVPPTLIAVKVKPWNVHRLMQEDPKRRSCISQVVREGDMVGNVCMCVGGERGKICMGRSVKYVCRGEGKYAWGGGRHMPGEEEDICLGRRKTYAWGGGRHMPGEEEDICLGRRKTYAWGGGRHMPGEEGGNMPVHVDR